MKAKMQSSGKVLKEIICRIGSISHSFFPLCVLQAFVDAIIPMSLIVFPSLIIDETAGQRRVEVLILWSGLCIILPALGSALKTITGHWLSIHSLRIEQELDLSINTVTMDTKYENLENPEVHTQIQKLQDGVNMVGPVSSVLQNQLIGIVKNCIFLAGCIPLLVALAATDQAPFSPVYLDTPPRILTFLCTHTPIFLLIIILMSVLAVQLKVLFRKKEVSMMESFAPVERAYQYYVSLRADYENGADIRLNALDQMLRRRMEDYNRSERHMHFAIGRLTGWTDGFLSVLLYLEMIAISFFVLCKILYGTISLGGFYLYANAFIQATSFITETMRQIGDLKIAMGYYVSYPALWKLAQKEPVASDGFSAASYSRGKDVIEIKHVSFRYPGNERWILKDLNLSIRAGEHVALVGRNGAGKSTLIKLLTGLYSLKDGCILIQGRDIRTMGNEEISHIFGVVYQDYRLFATSVEENVEAGVAHIDRERVCNALTSVGLPELADRNGLALPVSRHLSEEGILFSGGEEQKLAIARALYKEAPIVIMDEPAASLDPISELEINTLLTKLSEKHTALVISHRLSTCIACNRVIVMDEGRIVEDGTHNDLLRKNGLYAKMWKMQAEHYIK